MQMKRLRIVLAVSALIVMVPPLARARFTMTNDNGREVTVVASDSLFQKFEQALTLDAFLLLDATDRQFALPQALIASFDPKGKLTAEQRIGLRQILSQYYDAMAPSAREAIERQILTSAFLGPEVTVTRRMIDKFFPKDPAGRERRFCELARDATAIAANGGQKPTFRVFMSFGKDSQALFASLLDAEKNLGNEKCVLGEGDDEPLSLKEMRAEIAKAASKPAAVAPARSETATPSPVAPRTTCRLAEIKRIFADAIEAIETNGKDHRVYFGMRAGTCPVYGLVVRDRQGYFRYYQDTFREDSVPPLRFKTADEVVGLFQVVPAAPPAAAPAASGSARGGTRQ